MKKLFCLFALTALFSAVAMADIIPPNAPKPTPKGKQVELLVDVSNEVSEPTLVIKKSSTKLLRAALDEAEGLENNLAQTESARPHFTASTQTVVGGMFLTFAFVFGGVWLMRSKKPSKTVVGLFLIGILGGATILVTANIAPPQNVGINKNMLSEELGNRSRNFAKGKVRVKIVNGNAADSDIKLLIPNNEE
jgi:hypothetical protein